MDSNFLQADSKDSDQTVWLHRLIRVFTGRKFHFVVLRLVFLQGLFDLETELVVMAKKS